MKKYLLISICLLALCGCGKDATLKCGEEADATVVSFEKDGEKHSISALDLFNELKDNYGLEAAVKMIDTYILEKEFSDYKETATTNAKEYIASMKESYGSEEELLNAITTYTNYSTIEGYQSYLYLSNMQSHATEEYAKTTITDKQIEKYYKNEVKGDVEVYHILITPQVTDDLTDEEKETKEKEAKEKAKSLIEELNKADNKLETFKKLAKENSDDDATKDKDGNLGFINYGDLDSNYDELLDKAYKLKDGGYSKDVITTELGYHIIYRNSIKDKDKLEDIKDEIIKTLTDKALEEDTTMSITAMKYYRKLYNMNIEDSTLNRQYGIYMNNLINSANSTDEDTQE